MVLIKNTSIFKAWKFLSTKRKTQIYLLFILMVLSSFAEVFSIGAALPFLSAIIDADSIYQSKKFSAVIEYFSIKSSRELLFWIVLLFTFATLLAGIVRLSLLWFNSTLSYAIGSDLGLDMFERTLYQPYLNQITKNSSLVISGIANKANSLISGLIIPSLNIISSIVMILVIIIALIIFDPVISIGTFCGFSIIYYIILKSTHRRLVRNSSLIAQNQNSVIKILQEGLGGIRDVLIDGSQQFFCKLFHKADVTLRRAEGENTFIGSSPRLVVEALGMLVIAWTAYLLVTQSSKAALALPILGVLALSAQRLLPVIQQCYGAWVAIRAHQHSVDDALELLAQPMPKSKVVGQTICSQFESHIDFEDVSFRYSNESPWVLRGINLRVNKGDVIGIIGKTGGGKSTLIDILLGLLPPTSGRISIDGELLVPENAWKWQSQLAHVPQNIFLVDGTIQDNIAFTVPIEKVSSKAILDACTVAQLNPLLDGLKGGLNSFVGERGIRLSGGQRQRIGIARSLYKNSKVLVFDEATSALDHLTENDVINSIKSISEDITIFMISHRHATLKFCNKIIQIEDEKISWTGNYEDLLIRDFSGNA